MVKKSVKLAVERNRIKRQIRESFRHNQTILNGVDIVIVARRGIADLSNIELRQQFDKMWKRLARQRLSTSQAAPSDSVGQSNA